MPDNRLAVPESQFGIVTVTPRFYRLALVLINAMLCFACNTSHTRPAHSSASIKRIPIFDLVANTPDYSNAIAAADRDLAGDVWTASPIRVNESRGRRLGPIADKILREVRPKLKGMSVMELIRCLKVQDGSGFVTGYIGDEIYPQGNEMIIAEIRSRPAQEREKLGSLPVDGAYLDTGSQGPPLKVDELVREIARPKDSTNVHQ